MVCFGDFGIAKDKAAICPSFAVYGDELTGAVGVGVG
jgi:hypothetical protein